MLLKRAAQTEHDYYHLLSGVDLPLKSQTEIHKFFHLNKGKEFVDFDPINEPNEHEARVRYFYFFQDIFGNRTDCMASILRKIENLLLRIQRIVGVDRRRNNPHCTRKGSQWFSITHGLAVYLLAHETDIVKAYRYGLGVDEIFCQTFAMESPFAKNIATNAMRYIDWNRGRPYVFRLEDYDDLMSSGKLFARKFDENIDMKIVDKIYCLITSEEK